MLVSGGVPQGSALEALWLQCCSDRPLVRSACCDAVVLLVDQGHADLQHVLNSVLNLLPSARYRQHTQPPDSAPVVLGTRDITTVSFFWDHFR